MTKISLEKFISKTKGKKLGLPWSPDSQYGQCVSLIQHYIKDCLEQPTKPRGNAKDWITSYVREGLGKVVKTPRKGDILVFPNEAKGYGHIAIYIGENKLYDQNNGRHDNGKIGYGTIFSKDYKILRPNVELVIDVVENKEDNLNTNYVVEKGDTLSSIASRFNTTYQKLAKYNNITNPNLIRIGQVIKIPSASGIKHKVVKGDTISGLCIKYYGKYTKELGNKIVESNKKNYPKICLNWICVGWILTIPEL